MDDALRIPPAVTKAFGTKARVAVAGTLNGFAFRTSLWPEGDGTHLMAINKTMQAGAKAKVGDVVEVVMNLDTKERVVDVPPELKQALAKDAKALVAYESFSYSHRKEYADWIASAKRPETKAARVEKAIEMLRAGKKTR